MHLPEERVPEEIRRSKQVSGASKPLFMILTISIFVHRYALPWVGFDHFRCCTFRCWHCFEVLICSDVIHSRDICCFENKDDDEGELDIFCLIS